MLPPNNQYKPKADLIPLFWGEQPVENYKGKREVIKKETGFFSFNFGLDLSIEEERQ